MTNVSLSELAEHRKVEGFVVLEVGQLALSFTWHPAGWVLDTGASVPPHAVEPLAFTRCLSERGGRVVSAEVFARLAVKEEA